MSNYQTTQGSEHLATDSASAVRLDGPKPGGRTDSRAEPTDTGRPVGLSPAARALLEELSRLEQERPEDLHIKAMEAGGRGPIARELARAGALLELAGGHLIGRIDFERRLSSLPMEGGVTSKHASRLWGCSHGRARAILDVAVAAGSLVRDAKRYFPSEAPRA